MTCAVFWRILNEAMSAGDRNPGGNWMRSFGIFLMLGGVGVLAGYGLYLVFRVNVIPLPMRIGVSFIIAGFFLTLSSVLRERIRVKDKYREIER